MKKILLFTLAMGALAYPNFALDNAQLYFVNGSAGIGTSLPQQRLHVLENAADLQGLFWNQSGTSRVIAVGANGGTNAQIIADSGLNRALIGGSATDSDSEIFANRNIYLATQQGSNYEIKMTLLKSGRVGIGTTAPTSMLSIQSLGGTNGLSIKTPYSSDVSSGLSIDVDSGWGDASKNNYGLKISATNNNIGGGRSVYGLLLDNIGSASVGGDKPNQAYGLYINNIDSQTGGQKYAIFSNSTAASLFKGNVQVNGSLIVGNIKGVPNFTPTYFDEFNILPSGWYSNAEFRFATLNQVKNNSISAKIMGSLSSGEASPPLVSGASFFKIGGIHHNGQTTPTDFNSGAISLEVDTTGPGARFSSALVFSTLGDSFSGLASEKMRILGNGNVGIGTTRPGAKLDIQGAVRASDLLLTLTSWADLVFDPNYKLLPLEQVEHYIKKHHHLPGIPSEKDVLSKPVSIAEMQKTLLQKVEELTLYTIQLHKENQDLKARLKALEIQ